VITLLGATSLYGTRKANFFNKHYVNFRKGEMGVYPVLSSLASGVRLILPLFTND
jgi:hypothetical protein